MSINKSVKLRNRLVAPRKKGARFIVFEGIDGAGVEVQTKLLLNYLKRYKKNIERLYYPDYNGPIGKLIHEYLHNKYDFSVDVQFLLYFTDFFKDKEKIEEWLREDKTIICDRYFTSAIAYQGLRGFPIERALKFAKLFRLPEPDLIFFLKISPETSIKRKNKEKQNLDRNEADKKFLIKLAKFYERIIRKQIFSRWIVIDGEKSIDNVFKQIKSRLKIE